MAEGGTDQNLIEPIAPRVCDEWKREIDAVCTQRHNELVNTMQKVERPENLDIGPKPLDQTLFNRLDSNAQQRDERVLFYDPPSMQEIHQMMSKVMYKLTGSLSKLTVNGDGTEVQLSQDLMDCLLITGQAIHETDQLRMEMAGAGDGQQPLTQPVQTSEGELSGDQGEVNLDDIIEDLDSVGGGPNLPYPSFWEDMYSFIDKVMTEGFSKMPDSPKDNPCWHIRHNPRPRKFPNLLIYHNSTQVTSESIEQVVKQKIRDRADTVMQGEHQPTNSSQVVKALRAVTLKAHNLLVNNTTKFSSHFSGDDSESSAKLPFVIYRGLFDQNDHNAKPRQKEGKLNGTVGLLLRGESHGVTGLLAATSAHVVLDNSDMESLDDTPDQRNYEEIFGSYAAAANDPSKNWYIQTDSDTGHLNTIGPPAFSFRQYHDTADGRLPKCAKFLQDIALIKIDTSTKCIAVAKYFDELTYQKHPGETNATPPSYKKILGMLKIEEPEDISKLEAKRARILVDGTCGHVVTAPHYGQFYKNTYQVSHRICFVTDEPRLVPAKSGAAVYLVTKQKNLCILGLLRGEQCKEVGDDTQTVYEAVLLWPAIHHVEWQNSKLDPKYEIKNIRYKP